ncbi:MAG TPA: hypothetical protein VGQ22_23905 [Steroidobacteraceae bacterium]|jgi:hypothetical protein|nr:hypothetical protein [Steroidobacteraceae bacterium]
MARALLLLLLLWGPDSIETPGRLLLWQKMRIDEDGEVLECLVINASGAPDFLVKRIEEQAKRMKFTPGYFVDVKVPESRHSDN